MITPKEITALAFGIGEKKLALQRTSKRRLFVASMMAGAFIVLGGSLAIIGSGRLPEALNSLSMAKLAMGLLFPLGLFMIVVLGGELFTGNTALLMPSLMKKRCTTAEVLSNWCLVYIGNLVGVVLITLLLVTSCDVLADFGPTVHKICNGKLDQTWTSVLLRGIGANWCVCLAIWLGLTAKTLQGKALGCWLPVMAFVVLGYEHSIANMYYFAAALFGGESGHWTVWDMWWRNLIPSTIGNIVGGALFVGCLHTWVHPDTQNNN